MLRCAPPAATVALRSKTSRTWSWSSRETGLVGETRRSSPSPALSDGDGCWDANTGRGKAMGSLEERNKSLWVTTTEPIEYGHLQPPVTVDVAVIGGGISGLTLARLLAADGVAVAVVEAGPLCAGATGYTTAKVTSLHSLIYAKIERSFSAETAAVYAAANEAAVAKVANLVEVDVIDCDLEAAAAYTYTESDDGIADIEAEVEAAQRAGLAASITTEVDLPYPVKAAVRVEVQYQFHPRKYCLGLAAAILRDGGTIFDRTRALNVDEKSSTVTTDRGTVQARAVVLATHLPFPASGGFFARTTPMRSYALAARINGERPRAMYITVDDPKRSVRSTPDGWVIVGGEGHKVGQDGDTTSRYATLEAWARERFEVASIGDRWSAQDYATADGLPYVGRLTPPSKNVFVATGYGKWGMTNGTVAAMILADLIAGRDNPWAATFDSTRLAVRQSAKNVLSGGVDVAKHLVGDRVSSLRAPSAEDLKPGSGGVVELDGDTVAAFRDEDGTLCAVSATCTHLGCRVSFNTAERTWDCPCHGSRFALDGSVIEGPAVEDLAPKTP